jgi:hypothetical protein
MIALTCLTLGYAQERAGGPLSQPGPGDNTQIETSYDPVKDVTTVRLKTLQVYGEPLSSSNYKGADEARFYASFTYPGQVMRARPRRVLLSLVSTSEDWKYTDYRHATALVDGKLMRLGGLVRLPSFSIRNSARSSSEDYTRQEISIALPLKTFLRIAGGKYVRIRMGPREFRLSEHHLGALRELAARINR